MRKKYEILVFFNQRFKNLNQLHILVRGGRFFLCPLCGQKTETSQLLSPPKSIINGLFVGRIWKFYRVALLRQPGSEEKTVKKSLLCCSRFLCEEKSSWRAAAPPE